MRQCGPEDLTVMTEREVAALAGVCGVLREPIRLRILLLLCGGERCVSDLVSATGALQPTVSHHLGIMRHAGLVTVRRQRKRIFYALATRLAVDAGRCGRRISNASRVGIHVSLGAKAEAEDNHRPGPAEIG